METTVTKRGQTAIPAYIRKQHGIQEGDKLVWLDDGESIRVIRVPADPISALQGSGKGENLVARLLADRNRDREKDQTRGG